MPLPYCLSSLVGCLRKYPASLLPSPPRGHKQIESVSDIFIFGFPTFSVGVELEKAIKQN
jgi:hypothetical protein